MKIKLLLLLFMFSLVLGQICLDNVKYDITIQSQGGNNSTNPLWNQNCEVDVSKDLNLRDKLAIYIQCNSTDIRGPKVNTYPKLDPIISTCDFTKWHEQRVIVLIDKFIKKELNYCIHNAPTWPTPKEYQTDINPILILNDMPTAGSCSSTPRNKNNKWIGLDAPSFVSWIYNYGFGFHFTENLGDQACGPNAPGKVLNNFNNLKPGDLLYIAQNSQANEIIIKHVVIWTGIKLTFDSGPYSLNTLLGRTPENLKHEIETDVQANKNNPIYLVAHSLNYGPDYIIYAGWIKKSTVMVRRVINPDLNLIRMPTNAKFENNMCKLKKQKKIFKIK
jgi:hypothetical protein